MYEYINFAGAQKTQLKRNSNATQMQLKRNSNNETGEDKLLTLNSEQISWVKECERLERLYSEKKLVKTRWH